MATTIQQLVAQTAERHGWAARAKGAGMWHYTRNYLRNGRPDTQIIIVEFCFGQNAQAQVIRRASYCSSMATGRPIPLARDQVMAQFRVSGGSWH